jgi:hypothetical protein
MANINVEVKGPKGPQVKESLLPAALPLGRGLAVVYGADEYHATLATAAGGAILGVAEEDAVSLELPVSVIEEGQTVLQIGAAITPGQDLAINATGQFVPAAAGNRIVARALSGNPNAGDYITGYVFQSQPTHP